MKSQFSPLGTVCALCLFTLALHTPSSAENTPSQATNNQPAAAQPNQRSSTATPNSNQRSNSQSASQQGNSQRNSTARSGMSPAENQRCSTFSCVDTNRDSMLSRDELTAYGDASLQWDTLDSDRNGSLSNQEWDSREGGSSSPDRR